MQSLEELREAEMDSHTTSLLLILTCEGGCVHRTELVRGKEGHDKKLHQENRLEDRLAFSKQQG